MRTLVVLSMLLLVACDDGPKDDEPADTDVTATDLTDVDATDTDPTDATDDSDATDEADDTDPTDPTDTTDDTDATDTTDDTDPTDDTDATDPTDLTDDTDPTDLTDDTDPTDPTDPTDDTDYTDLPNAAPVPTGLTLAPQPAVTADAIVATPSGFDPDGDAITWSFRWTVDGTGVPWAYTDTLPSSTHSKGSVVVAYATASDGFLQSVEVASDPLIIGNTPPLATNVQLSPGSATVLDTFTCTASASDVDGDTVGLTYAFTVNANPVSATGIGTLATGFVRDDVVVCWATPNDGTDDGVPVASGPVVVGNTPPTAPTVAIAPVDPDVGDELVCSIPVDAFDADGDALIYRTSWWVDEVLYTGSTSMTNRPGDTIPLAATGVGQSWRCEVYADDGIDDGDVGSATVTIRAGVASRIVGDGNLMCAWDPGSEAVCWGANHFDSYDPLPDDVQDIWLTGRSGCATDTSGALTCFAHLSSTIENPPSGSYDKAWPMTESACALRDDGVVVCWGDTGIDVYPPPATPFDAVDLTSEYGCGILQSTGELDCWGADVRGRTNPPGGTGWAEVTVGGTHACARKTSGAVSCWGEPPQGPFTVPGGTYLQVAASADSTCGITTSNTVACWGYMGSDVPMPGGTFRKLVVASGRACGIRLDDSLVCWGNDYMGSASPPSGSYADLTYPGTASCALTEDGAVHCWGNPSQGTTVPPYAGNTVIAATNNGTRTAWLDADGEIVHMGGNIPNAVPVPTGPFFAVAAGDQFGCALRVSDGTPACWGDNQFGQTTAPSESFVTLAADIRSVCGVRADGEAICWGDDFSGALTPPSNTDFVHITMGQRTACGMDDQGIVTCWGDGPVATGFPTAPVVELESGHSSACWTDALGQISCWGNPLSTIDMPPSGGGWHGLALGNYRACALDAADYVTCWGSNSPLSGGGEPTFPLMSLAVSSVGACGLKADGSLACWGDRWRQGALSR